MNNLIFKTQLTDSVSQSLANNTFVKISLSNYRGKEADMKNVYVKRALIKKIEQLSFTYRYKTKDIVKNYPIADGVQLLDELVGPDGFRIANVFTLEADYTYEYRSSSKILFNKKAATNTTAPSLDHDKQKNRLIATQGKPYLTALRVTDAEGNVYKATQDKYKQINHYVEILSSLLKELPKHDVTKVVDMGAGKGYLTFALYDYLTNTLKVNAEVTGVEYRTDLVSLCNQIAIDTGFNQLQFVQGTIEAYDSKYANVLIALHACDTATDDAIYKGIAANADLIVVAPCCHKQIRREIEKHKHPNDLTYLTRHGIFLERQAEMVTDGIRALVLEYAGYTTKIFEFISDAHTPKNVMLVGVKNPKAAQHLPEHLAKIKEAKAYFGIEQHYLEKLMGI